MTLWNLDQDAVSELLALPESGMGFQWVTAATPGSRSPFLIFNSSIAIDLEDLELRPGDDPAVILSNGLKIIEAQRRMGPTRTIFSAPSLRDFSLLRTRIHAASSVAPVVPRITLTSSLVKKMTLPSVRAFHRYSAFNPDRRIDPVTGDLARGSYAVPESEVPFLPTGFAAVGRLALPLTAPASHVYSISAQAGTAVEFGTIAPAFGQSGGGVEAYFPSGAVNVPPTPPSAKVLPEE
jgi:hypothetical protein